MSLKYWCAPCFALLMLIFCSTFLRAQTPQNPLSVQIKDPIYLKTPNVEPATNSKKSVGLYFNYDYDLCQAKYGNNYYKACGRALGHDGKRVENGVSIAPPIAGEWRWEGDNGLRFTPAEFWKAGTDYTVFIDLDLLGVPSSALLNGQDRKAVVSFRTERLEITFSEMIYMQDPDDIKRRIVSAHLKSNYPVDAKAFENRLRLEMEEESGGELEASKILEPFEITHDAGSMEAVMAVPIKTLPDKDHYLRIVVDPGLSPLHGGLPSTEAFSERARIPNLHSYLALSNIEASIMRDDNGAPSQIISFSTNVKIKPDEVLPHIAIKLLPEQHPVTQNAKAYKDKKQPFYEWNAENEVTPDILENCESISPKSMKAAGEYTTQIGLPIAAPPGRYLYLEVDANAPAFGGYTLGKKLAKIVKIPNWPHDIKIMQEGSILSLNGSKKLSLHARGTDKLSIEIAHIRPEALQHFISQTSGDIKSPSFHNWQFQKENIAKVDSKDIPMNFETPQKSQYAALDFAPYLKDGQKGLFLLNISGFYKDDNAGMAQQRFVLVTDMGLLVKQNADKSRDVFLASFSSGKPVSGASLSVLGRNGLSVHNEKTDKNGHIKLPDFTSYQKDREPVAIIAQKGDDFTFIPYNRDDRNLNLSKYDIGGNVIPAEGLSALIFTDRGIYRPGESVHIGALTRSVDWSSLPAELPLKMIITDPRGRVALETILKFPSNGLQELLFDTQEISPSGTYYANLYIANDGHEGSLLGSASFKVEDYQPDRLRIKTSFSRESKGWIKPENLEASIALTNLYGTPATDRLIKGKVTLNPAKLKFEGFEDYNFYDSAAAKPRSVEYDLTPAKTDSSGKTVLDLNLEDQEQATYSLNLQTQGFEAGSGRGVSAYNTALISPMDFVVGYKTDANLNYLKKEQDYKLNVIALGPTLEHMDTGDLTLELVERSFVSTLIKRNDGSYAYEATPREKSLSSKPFTITANGTALPLPTKDIGTYAYHLKDSDGRVLASIDFSIAGEGQNAAGKDKETVLDLKINKDSYDPGEDIELSIKAPYIGAGLITLESDHVLAYKWFKTDKTDTVQSISIPTEFSGKGYVNVTFVRDLNSREIYMSPLSVAVTPFIANTDQKTLKIEMSMPDKVKPGEPVTLSYKGNQKGKAIFYAIDTGILQVARYKTPDPVGFFLTSRALQVLTSQMLDLLMPEFDIVRSLSAQGGDAAAQSAALGKHLNPFQRKTLAPAVYWSGIVDVDTAEKTLSFTPPGYFNGEMQIMAVGVSETGVGNAEKPITVQGDVIVTPNIPLFLAPGDEAVISATIANNTGFQGEAKLSVKSSEGVKISGPSKSKTISSSEEKTFNFTMKAGDVLGNATVTFEAALGDITQKSEATLSIRPPAARETTLLSGYAEHGSGEIALKRTLHKEFAQKEASLSALPTPYIYSLLRYLDNFPYGCSEQLISQAAPHVVLYGLPEFSKDQDIMKKKITETVANLRQRQGYDGGFSYWGGSETADEFISVYALDFLTQAMEKDLPVPDEMTRNALSYVRTIVNNDIADMDDARTKAYGIYVLTRNGVVTTNEILHLLKYFEDQKITDWKTDLMAVYIAASYKLMQQSELADETLNNFNAGINLLDITYKGQDWSNEWYNPLIKYARYLTLLAQHFPERMAALDPKMIFTIAAYINEERYSTISSSYSIQALQNYAAAQDDKISSATFKVIADGAPVSTENIKPIYSLPFDTKEIKFSGEDLPVFYTVSETGFDDKPDTEPVSFNMEIERSYKTEKGDPLAESIAIGDVIEAEIKIRSHDNRYIQNVAIVDLLPGGLELEQGDVKDTGGMEAVDRREDRVIAFSNIGPNEKTFRYRLRAVSKGTFIVPAPFAEAMYDLTTKAKGRAGTITIKDVQ